MIALLGVVLLTSLLGSVHCVAMCGPLIATHGVPRSGAARFAMWHALGRLATYVALGAAAGAVGRAIDVAGELGAVQRVATLAAGGIVIGWGLWGLAVALGAPSPRLAGGRFQRGLVQIGRQPPARRAVLTGLLTGLLPCGWLWAFVVSAAGSGSVVGGAAIMAAFWLGTVPAMVGLLTLAGPLLGWLRVRLPVVTPLVLIGIGVATLSLRWRDAGAAQVAHPHCHDTGAR